MADSEGLTPCCDTPYLRRDNRNLQLMRRTETPHQLGLPNVRTQPLDPAHYRHVLLLGIRPHSLTQYVKYKVVLAYHVSLEWVHPLRQHTEHRSNGEYCDANLTRENDYCHRDDENDD